MGQVCDAGVTGKCDTHGDTGSFNAGLGETSMQPSNSVFWGLAGWVGRILGHRSVLVLMTVPPSPYMFILRPNTLKTFLIPTSFI